MNKQSAYKPSQNNNNQQESNRYKNMSYVNHPEKYPLELQGRMKRHSQLHGQQNIKSIINYEQYNRNQSSTKDNNCQDSRISQNSRCSQKQHSRNTTCLNSALAEKILANNKLASTNYEKKVVPESDPRSSKFRPQSVKTYKESRQGTGLNYILAADQKNFYKQQEKRHVEEYHVPRRENYGKKCNISSAKKQSESNQIVSLMNENISTENIQSQNQPNHKSVTNISSTSSIFNTVHHPSTTKRISNDIHSSFDKKESVDENRQVKSKYESQNMFKTVASLGYEYQKSKEIGSQKMMEMMGSQAYWMKKGNTESLRQKRDDWRRSTIVIE